jgi:hypothetical protein
MSFDIRVDLRPQFGQPRDQGRRPTCLAFASSDLHASLRTTQFEPLSAEFAFYHAAQRKRGVFNPHAGVSLRSMLEAIEKDGQPQESGWPYLMQLPIDSTAYKPPSDPGPLFRRSGEYKISSFDVICQSLDNRIPLLIAFVPTIQFHRARSGVPVRSTLGDIPSGSAHAVVAVGWGKEGTERLVLVRNSWGAKWAENGCAWLSESYLAPRLYAIITME